jgi:hypothetical protein
MLFYPKTKLHCYSFLLKFSNETSNLAILEVIPHTLQFIHDNGRVVTLIRAPFLPGASHTLLETRHIHPIVLKKEYFSIWNICVNVHYTRRMIMPRFS